MKKLAVFDLDSTLLEGESINQTLEHILTNPLEKQRLENIRAEGMRGKIGLKSSLTQRIAFFKYLHNAELEKISQKIPWVEGAHQTIKILKEEGYITICLSASFRTIARRTMSELNMDAYASNSLEIKNNRLSGKISGELMQHTSKGKLLKSIQKELGITPRNTLVVGDGANDLSMFDYAETRIAFCAEEILKTKATHIISTNNLLKVLDCI